MNQSELVHEEEDTFLPESVMTRLSSAALMHPFSSLLKRLNASFISSSLVVLGVFPAIRVRNWEKLMVSLPPALASLIVAFSSASVGFRPSEHITVPRFSVVIVPSPSKEEMGSKNGYRDYGDGMVKSPVSNKEKASLNSTQMFQS